jgi:hypothetical protein
MAYAPAAWLTALLILSAEAGLAAPAEDALVARFTADPAQGGTLVDRSGNGHSGRVNGATCVASPRGMPSTLRRHEHRRSGLRHQLLHRRTTLQ